MDTSRRAFLAALGATGAAATVHARPGSGAADDPLRGWIIVNSLGGFEPHDVRLPAGPGPDNRGPTIDRQRLKDALASGMTAANQTIGYVFGDKEPFEETIRQIGLWDMLIRDDPELIKVYTTRDIHRASIQHRLGIILGFQNAAMMGEQPDRVDIFADLGIKVIQLTYNSQNTLGGGSLTPDDPGLTPFGHQVLQRLNARHVIVDLSHSGRKTCLDAARASSQPIAITHTGCQALVDHPRNTTDEALRLVASRGGYVGIYSVMFLAKGRNPQPDDLLAHLEHAINVCGEDHVGIGTDGGTSKIDVEAAKAQNVRANAERQAAGIAAPGESATILPFIPQLSGPDQFRVLAEMLEKRGHSVGRIEKILGRNFVRYAREIWGT